MCALKDGSALLLACGLSLLSSCAGSQAPDTRRAGLPFIVRVSLVEVEDGDAGNGGGESRTAGTGGEGEAGETEGGGEEGDGSSGIVQDRKAFTRAVAEAIDAAGIFSLVLTDAEADEASIPADLSLKVRVSGDDFGPGTTTVGRALLSTVAWLFTGHLSWFLDDQRFCDSRVVLKVSMAPASPADVEKAPGDDPEVFRSDLLVNNLSLSFMERAGGTAWLLNVLCPSWLSDGDPATARASLERRAVEYFGEQEPAVILSQLPGGHYEKLDSYLVYDVERRECFLIAKSDVQLVEIRSRGGRTRALGPDDVLGLEVRSGEARRAIQLRLSQLETGIGTSERDRYFVIPLEDSERGFVRIKAILERRTAQWTVDRR